ncbi:hypothetical protein, partial [Mesorhizobium sp. M7A.T.Ca.US.000.02.2.1]|uniref:hypothetical protein n=1 Tax=Mesorhizobium sp. M7A.T.Ca.US.000.02.2.1 TaxID=2496793 RepID=UPI000FD2C03A
MVEASAEVVEFTGQAAVIGVGPNGGGGVCEGDVAEAIDNRPVRPRQQDATAGGCVVKALFGGWLSGIDGGQLVAELAG